MENNLEMEPMHFQPEDSGIRERRNDLISFSFDGADYELSMNNGSAIQTANLLADYAALDRSSFFTTYQYQIVKTQSRCI